MSSAVEIRSTIFNATAEKYNFPTIDYASAKKLVSQYFIQSGAFEAESINSLLYVKRADTIAEKKENGFLAAPHFNHLINVACKFLCDGSDEIPPCTSIEHRRPYLEFLGAAIAKTYEEDSDVGAELGAGLWDVILPELSELYYSAIRPEVCEMFSHLSASEMMFIDGDSIIIEAMCNVNVDWDMMQPLHVVSLVQNYLKNLIDRGAKFQIMFFECHKWFFAKAPQKGLIRDVIRRTLMAYSKDPKSLFPVLSFDNYWGDAFLSHFGKFKPEFIVLNDGEQMWPVNPEDASTFRSVLDDVIIGEKAARAMHRMQAFLIAKRIHIVYTSRHIYKDNDVYVFTIRSHSTVFIPYSVIAADLCDITNTESESMAEEFAISKPLKTLPDAVVNMDIFKGDDRFQIIAAAIFNVLNDNMSECNVGKKLSPVEMSVLKVTLISVAVMSRIPLDSRKLPVQPCESITSAMNMICDAARRIYGSTTVSPKDYHYDLLDGHLIASLCDILARKELGAFLSPVIGQSLDDVWAAISNVPTEKESISNSIIKDLPAVVFEYPDSIPSDIVLRNHPLAQELCDAFDVKPSSTVPTEDIKGKGTTENLVGWVLDSSFDQYNAVFDQSELAEREQCLGRKARKRAEKDRNRYVKSIEETATSMNVQESRVRLGGTGGPQIKRGTQSELIARLNAVKKVESTLQTRVGLVTYQKRRVEQAVSTARTAQLVNPNFIPNNELEMVFRGSVDTLLNTINSFTLIEKNFYNENVVDGTLSPYQLILKVMQEDGLTSEPGEFVLAEQGDKYTALSRMKAFGESQSVLKQELDKEEKNLAKQEKRVGKGAKDEDLEVHRKRVKELSEKVFINETDKDIAVFRASFAFFHVLEDYVTISALIAIVQAWFIRWCDQREKWSHLTKEEVQDKDWDVAVQVFISVQRVMKKIESKKVQMLSSERDVVRAAFRSLELGQEANGIIDQQLIKAEGLRSLLGIARKYHIPSMRNLASTPEIFQLNKMGHLLPRSTPKTDDDRVVFNPDIWQREVMDIVDSRGSAVVCAPTSAGKTFISYYCMEQVFAETISQDTRDEDIGVVVYVAPTRALINQAVAEIYGRYKSKSYGKPGLNIFGVLGGKDFVRHPFDAQAVVVLPEVLETLLLSPHHQDWLKRVKYFIFDEIHSLESSGNGSVWERLLTMVRAPFVALSATLGEATQLIEWLNRSQKQLSNFQPDENRRFQVQLVPKEQKIERWSDIEKHVFLPQDSTPLNTVNKERAMLQCNEKDLSSFHPLSAVEFEMLRIKNAFPPDVSIVPRESLKLYSVMLDMSKPLRKEFSDVPAVIELSTRLKTTLSPAGYFKSTKTVAIDQRAARDWEKALKEELLNWVLMSSEAGCKRLGVDLLKLGEDPAEKNNFYVWMKKTVVDVLETFKTEVDGREESLQTAAEESTSEDCVYHPDTFQFVEKNTMRLVLMLMKMKMTPTIFFTFDQEECENLVRVVVTALEDAEEEYRKTPEFLAYVDRLAKEKEANEKKKRSNEAMKGKSVQKDENGKATVQEADEKHTIQPDSDFEIPSVLPEFSLCSRTEEDDDVKLSLENGYLDKNSMVFRGLQRGIGLHHGGVSGKMRSAVERLFRKKVLPVVFATQGLALGVHSPCRSVVLAGDSPSLNVTEFRQMSGRAGRRGLDFLGHVIFFGISLKKVRRLLTSDMMNLKGHSYMDSLTTLRLLQLHDRPVESNAQAVQRRWRSEVALYAKCGFVEPLFALSRVRSHDFTRDHVRLFRYLTAHFVDQGLLYNPDSGAISSMGHMVTTMLNVRNSSRIEVAAFMIAAFLTSTTAIHSLESPDDAAFVFAHLMSRRNKFNIPLEMHRSATRDPFVKELHNNKRCHDVYLNPLSDEVEAAIQQVAKSLLAKLSLLAQEIASEIDAKAVKEGKISHDEHLPFQIAAGENDTVAPLQPADEVLKLDNALRSKSIPTKARSTFLALCGKGDLFESVEDIRNSVRPGILFDFSDIPVLDYVDMGRHDGAKVLMNACFFDFMRFGSQSRDGSYRRLALRDFNGMNESNSWGTLDEIFRALLNLREVLKKIAPIVEGSEGTVEGEEDGIPQPHIKILFDMCDKCKEYGTLRKELNNIRFEIPAWMISS